MSKLDPLLMATVVLLSVSRFSSSTSSRIGETRICCPRRRRSQSVSTAGRNGWRESSTSSVLPRLAVFSALNNRYVRGLLQASIFSAKKGMYVYAECRPILRLLPGARPCFQSYGGVWTEGCTVLCKGTALDGRMKTLKDKQVFTTFLLLAETHASPAVSGSEKRV